MFEGRIFFCLILFFSSTLTFGQDFRGIKIGNSVWMANNLKVTVKGSESYNHDEKNDLNYGRLYTWDAAKNACPSGWHLPAEKEWDELIENLGGYGIAAKELKTGGSSGLNTPLGGFSSIGGYMMQGNFGTFWTSTQFDPEHAWYVYIKSKDNIITKTYFTKLYKLSVRCVKN